MSFTDTGTTVTAHVRVDRRGAVRDFSTTDRFTNLPDGLVRAEWTTPIERWDDAGVRPIPGPSGATWHLPDGPLTYIEATFGPGSVRYNADLRDETTQATPRSAPEACCTRAPRWRPRFPRC